MLDFPAEYAGCPGYVFNLFGLIRPLQGYSSTGENYHLVAGIAQQSYTAYRDQRVWGTTNDPNIVPGAAFDYTNTGPDATSLWEDEIDYANPFDYAMVQGVARTVRTYYLNRDPITGLTSGYIDLSSGTPGPGDSADYMADLVIIESDGGAVGFGSPLYLDSSFDSADDYPSLV